MNAHVYNKTTSSTIPGSDEIIPVLRGGGVGIVPVQLQVQKDVFQIWYNNLTPPPPIKLRQLYYSLGP